MVNFTNKFIRSAQVLAIIVGLVLGVFLWSTKGQDISLREIFLPGTPVVHIGEVSLRVEIAQTTEERTQGLSGRASLEDGVGLLFIFPKADYHSMWMKDMNFPIDIIWISEDLKVVSMNDNVTPDSYPRTFRPKQPARYAIEVSELYLETFGIREGQSVRMPFEYFED